ncbi:MAG TPA: hypothetical protein VLA56_04695 [Pseudomonadales bacterium]|nr:hypothetical protein [Pseudomonadales bacterium]
MNWLRYLGKQVRIIALYEAFVAEDRPLHPIQLSRLTGLDMFEVQRCLAGCPELFVKLPRNAEGLVRWRLTSATGAMEPEAVLALIQARVRSEKLQVTAITVIVASLLLVVALTVIPAARMGLI